MNEHEHTNPQTDQDRVARALETIIQLLVGKDLESLRQSVQQSESGVSRSIEEVRTETTASLEESRRESEARVEELVQELAAEEQRRSEALADLEKRIDHRADELQGRIEATQAQVESRGEALSQLEGRIDRSVTELRELMEASHTQAENRTESTRVTLESQLAGTEQNFKKHLDEMARNLATVQMGLQQQMETSERLSSVLSNLASIFSGQMAASATAPVEAELSDSEERKELENVLDKVFPAGS